MRQPSPRAPPPPPPQPASLLIESPIRSGQSVIFPYGDVTVLGSVASGAEIVAGGSIHVYGTLRGRAMAGSMGNARARIFCSRNEAELLAIDGYYQTAESMDASLRGRPVQVWLEGAGLNIEALGLKQRRRESARWPKSSRHIGQGRRRQDHVDRRARRRAGADRARSVVVVDFDVGLRNLDLVMGAERRVVFDLINVVQGDAKLPQALIRDKRIETL